MSCYDCCDYCGCCDYWGGDTDEESGDWLSAEHDSLFVTSELCHGL